MSDETVAATKGAKGKKAAGAAKGAKAAGAKAKPKAAPGADAKAKTEGQIARLMVRAVWMQEWSVANPDGKPEDRKKAWAEARQAAVDRNLKTYRRAVNMLSRQGVTMTYTAPAKKEGAAADDEGGED